MYRLVGRKRLRRGDELIEPGEEFEPTEAEIQAFGDKLEKVESDTSHDEIEESDADETDSTPPMNEDGEFLCAGKEDGQCSRTVDEAFGRCWQH